MENNIICERYDEHHSTLSCKIKDKIIPLEFPQANYAKQVQNNQKDAKFTEPQKGVRLPDLYYDHTNYRLI